jgi:hypothetical protein
VNNMPDPQSVLDEFLAKVQELLASLGIGGL